MNILLITSDQQHYTTLGVTNPKIKTPALDRLCREGMRFDRAYCPNPTCTPTRASIITGLYPSHHGAWSLGTKLSEDVPTVGDVFRDHGYRTMLIGKAHFQQLISAPGQESIESYPTMRDLDFWRGFSERHGPWYGFDHVELARNHADEAHVGQHYALWMEEKGLKNWRDYFWPWPYTREDTRKRLHHWDLPQEYHYTTWTGERTIANIEHAVEQRKPFFCWSSYHDPHPPYLVPEPWASMYDPADMDPGTLEESELDRMPPHFAMTQQRDSDWSVYQETPWGNHGFNYHVIDDERLRKNMAIYYGMVSFMDHQIGRTLDRLDELGIADETLVAFSTDHGHFLGQHGLTAKGAFHYEDVLRVPFIVRWPGRTPAGQTSEALQSLVDLPGTFLRAAGITGPDADKMMQSVDQLDVWCGRAESARDHVVVEFRHQPTKVQLRTYIDARYKLTVYRGETYGELFDLRDDPEERRNLWDAPEHAALKAELFQRAIQAELEREPMPHPRVAGA